MPTETNINTQPAPIRYTRRAVKKERAEEVIIEGIARSTSRFQRLASRLYPTGAYDPPREESAADSDLRQAAAREEIARRKDYLPAFDE